MVQILIQLFVTISERIFLRWYEAAKARQVKNVKKAVDSLPDSDVVEQLRDKYTRD